jgi:hypothetical protein
VERRYRSCLSLTEVAADPLPFISRSAWDLVDFRLVVVGLDSCEITPPIPGAITDKMPGRNFGDATPGTIKSNGP